MAFDVFCNKDLADRAIGQQKAMCLLEDGGLVHTKRMTRAVKKADPRYKISRKWLRGQLLATGTFHPRVVERMLDNIRKHMGYRKYWQHWGPMIIWDQDAYKENCRRARMDGKRDD